MIVKLNGKLRWLTEEPGNATLAGDADPEPNQDDDDDPIENSKYAHAVYAVGYDRSEIISVKNSGSFEVITVAAGEKDDLDRHALKQLMDHGLYIIKNKSVGGAYGSSSSRFEFWFGA